VALILIVDDNQRARDAVAWLLQREGHEVRVADNGRTALALLERANLDIVVTDIHMPETDGLELIMECRRRWPDLPVIAMSGGSMIPSCEVLDDARLLGAAETLEKPFEFGVLRAAVERLVKDTAGTRDRSGD
jgi:DNA-binding NtrC family response regulator